MNTMQALDLLPIVTQIVGQPEGDSLAWQLEPLQLQGGSVVGIVSLARIAGTAQVAGQTQPWSVVVKSISEPPPAADGANTTHDPAAWNYWRREVAAYQSGILAELTGNLVAPRCYAVTEHPNGEWRIWLEDITESPQQWTMARHNSAARHLGQFNGMYLTGHPLPPVQPWIYRGRSRDWIQTAPALLEPFRRYVATVQGRQGLTEQNVARIERLLAQAPRLLAQLARLPLCLCHHDAHRRNLMARDSSANELQTVAIDWSYLGYGEVGAEIGITTAVSLSWMAVDAARAREFDQAVFDGYIAGLRDVGWQGDPRLARFGYTATAALVTGVAGTIAFGALVWSNEESTRALEQAIGHSREAIFAQQALYLPFLLDLGDEALQLMEQLP
ncbi:MAG: phosphotransferase [Caldilineaceae bacterium]|nr:phosphotransferase [Caldilineaceae bacterium]